MVRHHVVAEAQKPHLKLRLKSTPRGIRLSGHWVEGLVEKPAFASLREEAGELTTKSARCSSASRGAHARPGLSSAPRRATLSCPTPCPSHRLSGATFRAGARVTTWRPIRGFTFLARACAR
jgi:hypothetical protein